MIEQSLIGELTSKKKIAMVGCLMVGWELINSLLETGVSFDYFVLVTEEKAIKAKISGYANFVELAEKYKIKIYYVEKYNLKSEKDLNFFRKEKFDLIIQGGWQRLFPDEMLSTLTIGSIGIHGSADFLPKGRGRSPLNWSLIEGKKRFVIHLFLMKPGVDDGDIFDYAFFDINEYDTIRTLYLKNFIVTRNMILRNLADLLDGKLSYYKQVGEPTYYPQRKPEDGQIDWSKSVFEIYNLIRALTHPYPGAFTFLNGKKVFIYKAYPFDTRIAYFGKREGEVVEVFANGEFIINCNSGLLLVIEADFSIEKGDVFNSNNFHETSM